MRTEGNRESRVGCRGDIEVRGAKLFVRERVESDGLADFGEIDGDSR